MTDLYSKEKRSEIMALIKSKNTKPEIMVRSALHRLGFRFRLHDIRLPGKPDIVLPKYRTVIQVRGCFWHKHGCRKWHFPKSRLEYWKPKLMGNKKRDALNDKKLRSIGWRVINVWECKCRTKAKFYREIQRIIRLVLDKFAKLSNC